MPPQDINSREIQPALFICRVIRLGLLWLAITLLGFLPCMLQPASAQSPSFEQAFRSPPAESKPWAFWYWMNAAVSREGITADLEAMQRAGIGGAYLMSVQGPLDSPIHEPPVVQLTPEWWNCVRHAATEADRLGLELAMHACDGWAVAGGPWVTPELSMQELVWTTQQVEGGQPVVLNLPQPTTREEYYRDVAVLAFPSLPGSGLSTTTLPVKASTNAAGQTAHQLLMPGNEERLRSAEPCWIEFAFDEPFTCRSVTIRPEGRNYQCQRLRLEAVNEEGEYHPVCQLQPPRHGWQDNSKAVTHSVPATTSRTFRLVFDPEGSEPGSEDLDYAKWSPVLKVIGIELASEHRIHHYRGKNGSVWRVSPRTTDAQIPEGSCVAANSITDLTRQMDAAGNLRWSPPAGNWTVLRMGHTSTGQHNDTGGGGKGLECDKFNPAAVKLQYDSWFGEARQQLGPELARRVLTTFHVDSWECGCQNWSSTFAAEFETRRGYSLLAYLPVVAGYPVENVHHSESFLYDFRQTIAELVDEKFFATLAKINAEHGCRFTGENVAPTFVSDGMKHHQHLDMPMGEFWLRSPTHDKPNDILDAISAGHVYGKQIIGAEAFTQLRNEWDEHPAMLKPLADRHYAMGINKLVYHVYAHNPFLDRQPGVTLGGIGVYMQRDQSWWPLADGWVDYCRRVQAVLQHGNPVVDIAVFTGEEIPRRAVLPERLVDSLPGLIGKNLLDKESRRLANRGVPVRQQPQGVTHSANMTNAEDWLDPLRGYKYDSINRDALLRLAKVKNGRIELPGGASYGLLVVPGDRPLSPNSQLLSPAVLAKLAELAESGAHILIANKPENLLGHADQSDTDRLASQSAKRLMASENVLHGQWKHETLEPLGIVRDFCCDGAADIAWAHRHTAGSDVYFVSNQLQEERTLKLSLRIAKRRPEIWNPVTGEMHESHRWHSQQGRTQLQLNLPAHSSAFVVLRKSVEDRWEALPRSSPEPNTMRIDGPWQLTFTPTLGIAPQPRRLETLADLSESQDDSLRHFAGMVKYRATFNVPDATGTPGKIYLDLGKVGVMAKVSLNNQPCGIAWTAPYRLDVTDAIKPGKNNLTVTVATTWRNRMIGDSALQKENRTAWTTANWPAPDSLLQPAGLIGPVVVHSNTLQKALDHDE